jgi:hypothetical protein
MITSIIRFAGYAYIGGLYFVQSKSTHDDMREFETLRTWCPLSIETLPIIASDHRLQRVERDRDFDWDRQTSSKRWNAASEERACQAIRDIAARAGGVSSCSSSKGL